MGACEQRKCTLRTRAYPSQDCSHCTILESTNAGSRLKAARSALLPGVIASAWLAQLQKRKFSTKLEVTPFSLAYADGRRFRSRASRA